MEWTLLLMLFPTTFFSAAYKSIVLADSPSIYWRLGETSGTSATDASGNGHTGTYHTCTLNQVGALANDPDKCISVASASSVDQAATFNYATVTVECWIKITTYPAATGRIAGFVQGGADDKELSVGASGLPSWYVYDGTAKQITGGSALGLNRWYHLAGTADGTTMKLYVNGSLAASVAAGNTYTGYTGPNILLAGTSTNFGQLNTSYLDEFAVYPVALPAARILAHYTAGVDG